MVVGEFVKSKDIQGAGLVAILDNILVYLRENGIFITGKRTAIIDIVRVLETLYGAWVFSKSPGTESIGRGILLASLPLTLHSARYFAEGMIKGYSKPVIHSSYTPPPTPPPVVVSSGGANITSY